MKAFQNDREDLSSFLSSYLKNLDDLYKTINQNSCRTWSISTEPISLKYPIPSQRTFDEFFDNHESNLVYPTKCLTSLVSYLNECYKRAETEFYPKLALFSETIKEFRESFRCF